MDRSIIVENLVKKFEVNQKEKGLTGTLASLIHPNKKTVNALKGVSFSTKPGELIGFIGPNGAGKTTTLKILSGILHPTSGLVNVLGYVPWERKDAYLKKISLVMGQKNQLWWDLPAQETFELNKAIYEIPERKYRETVLKLTKLLDVEDLLSTPVRRLSLGQRMKMELIAALLHNPEVVFLDEPTIGLDLIAQQKMRDFITDYNRQFGATILLTSHNMDDLVGIAKRVVVIDNGEIIFDGNLNELVAHFAKEKIIKVSLSHTVDYKKLSSIGIIKEVNLPFITLSVPREASAMAAAEILQSFPIDDLTIEEVPVEDVIRQVFKGGLNEK
ncbi:ATP-binding cassette domain-containing protein [Candidatus Microgenomates bacterium]|nr:ATP-binding cassette domain-containing protein [Candidatus Microgenomates bacterium]